MSVQETSGTKHEFVLAPSLAPFGNATEDNGSNQAEPSRGSCPAPQRAEIRLPHEASEAFSEEITRDQYKADRARGLLATQPQPVINTKALEATSYSVPHHGSQLPYTHDHGEADGRVESNQFHHNAVSGNEHGVHGSIDGGLVDRRHYHMSEHNTRSRSSSQTSATMTVTSKRDRTMATNAMQPTNEGTGKVGKGFKLPTDFEDDDKNLADGSVPADPDDPDAIYRVVSEHAEQPFDAEAGSTIRLSKEERRAEKQEQKARKRQKLVRDPVTGQDIWIENARGSTKRFMAQDGVVVPDYKVQQKKDERTAAELMAALHKIPFKDDKTNLLFYPMEPPEWKELLEESQRSLFQWAYIMIFVLISVQIIFSPFPARYSLWINALCAIGSVIFLQNAVRANFLNSFAEAERVRGEHATLSGVPESVEWLNNIIRTIWPTINPELFGGPVDLLEDVMQKQVPKVVHTVKVSDLDIGSIPLRVLSMRFLPDDGAPRGDEDAAGEYVNLEVAFGYRAGSTDKSLKSKAKNIHMLIWFLVGLRNVLGIPIPIWVQVHGILGKARVRVQLLPDPPFLKNGTISLLGMPKIELSTVPISTRFINVMYLPFVSQLVSFAVKIVLKDLIAPRSYTMDVSKLMVGDDVKKETASIGVLMIALHGATDVPRADHRPGRSKVDPYATVQYSRYGKTHYSTRVIHQDYNPVWEETCFLPILPSAVKAGERIRINLWDSDRLTADDLLGRVEIDLTTLVKNPGVFERRIDKVVGTSRTKMHWSIGFFGKRFVEELDVPAVEDSRVPPELRDHPDFKTKDPAWSVDSKIERLICRTPPNKEYPGILSVQIHQINDLAVVSTRKTLHNRQGRVLDAEDVEQGKEDDSGSAPSSYCTVTLNDELVYKTRTRAYTNRPIFNASFERFVRSFSDTKLRISVRDQRFREDDSIIGILPLALAEELSMQGQTTRWYPLSEGIGYGMIRVSLLFRSVECQIPRTLQGWNLGTLHIYTVKARVGATDAEALRDCSLRIDTMLGHKTIGAVHADTVDDGLVAWDLGAPLVMPIRRRHASSLNIEAHRGGVAFSKTGFFSGIYGACIIALSALDDDHRDVVKIPIFQTDDYVRFKQNSLTQDGSEVDRSLRRLGYMEVDCVLMSGLSESHRRFAKRSKDLAQTHEAWDTEKSYRKRLAYDARQERKEAIIKSRHSREQGTPASTIDSAFIPQRPRSESKSVQFARPAMDDTTNHDGGMYDNEDVMNELDWSSDNESTGSVRSRKSIKEWINDKKEDRRERHRRHRGIMQKKPARTASWLKNGLKRGLSKASRALSLNREDDIVEREVDS
ncbi:Putative uncharacterized protein B5O22.140 [Taphrina deformans PYCC 5710]|uniref:C2 domain protein n=1 Tax=Taphrina deformans (strain PYCC 5710 / ATCC 11124 / CBS 356.35 / IMI 108563 / JCM 9778 / NBRC 8474) TaxID=1097556 RepID=R4XD08_TAPDE|nr:Putative uncharacterized protein B5O22.140 [Taphrina deformans PYCC 5710]|eukprot:CCG83493.1 Putative uncharacterized protein B5O22.140 [Taphrina deformans PYCC 5710]